MHPARIFGIKIKPRPTTAGLLFSGFGRTVMPVIFRKIEFYFHFPWFGNILTEENSGINLKFVHGKIFSPEKCFSRQEKPGNPINLRSAQRTPAEKRNLFLQKLVYRFCKRYFPVLTSGTVAIMIKEIAGLVCRSAVECLRTPPLLALPEKEALSWK